MSAKPPPSGLLALGAAVLGAGLAVVILALLGMPVVSFSFVVVAVLAVATATAVALLLAAPVPGDEPAPPEDPAPRGTIAPVPSAARPRVPPPVPRTPAQRAPEPTPPETPLAPPPARPLRTPPPARHVVHLLADEGAAASGTGRPAWWNQPGGAAGAPVGTREPPSAPTRDAPELDTYLDDALVAQCPRCGEFRVDVESTGEEYAFSCPRCQHYWTWRSGDTWPGIDVTPRRGRARGPASS